MLHGLFATKTIRMGSPLLFPLITIPRHTFKERLQMYIQCTYNPNLLTLLFFSTYDF